MNLNILKLLLFISIFFIIRFIVIKVLSEKLKKELNIK